MLRMYRYAPWGTLMAGLLSGCSWFSHGAQPVEARTTRVIDVDVIAGANANPDVAGRSQPVKICVIESSRPGWIPEGVASGNPCRRDTASAEEILSQNHSILRPKERMHYHFEVPMHQPRWIVIGAEFQHVKGTSPLTEYTSPAKADSAIKVTVGATSLEVTANDKVDK